MQLELHYKYNKNNDNNNISTMPAAARAPSFEDAIAWMNEERTCLPIYLPARLNLLQRYCFVIVIATKLF